MSLSSKFEVGENVLIASNGKIGTINKILTRADNVGYRVTVEGKMSAYPEKYLKKIIDEEQEICNSFVSNEFAGAEEFRLFQTWFRLKRPIEGHFYSYLASKTIFNTYQFKPLSKFISPGSEERLFIADEVGVGKTIETGIILTELVARKRVDRRKPILIVCPSSLGPKWVNEMQARFNFRFYLHENGVTLRNLLKSILKGYTPDGMEWSIVSLSLLRSENNFKLLQEISKLRDKPLWSMVIVDEAHHMRNIPTISHKVGLMLSDLTEMMLMLSATPLNLKDEDLFNQMHILNPSMFPDQQIFSAMLSPVKSINRCRRLLLENEENERKEILKELSKMRLGPLGEAISSHAVISSLNEDISTGKNLTVTEIALYDKTLLSLSPLDQSFTRTLKQEAFENPVIREPIKVPVLLSRNELEFYYSVIQVVQDLYLKKGGNSRALGFITNVPRRMVTSCIPAMREYLDWCIKENKMISDEEYYENGEYSEEDIEDDSSLKEFPLPKELKKQFVTLHNMANRLKDEDTKYQEFSELVRKILSDLENPQLIVFSFFVRTLEYLKTRLSDEGYNVGLICGKVPLHSEGENEGRYEIMKAFETKELNILLSSEVGGEGLDFQFCQAIINYDLPYNPMKIEQRIGRIDRFGQEADKILVASMYLKDTVDEKIYSALYDRIKMVQDSIGDLQPILSIKLIDLQKDIISGNLSESQLEERTKEIELAIEKLKIEKQKFEAQRNELLGDEHFNNILLNLDKQSEFVQPVDASRLTSICLNLWEACKYDEKSIDRGIIKLSKEIKMSLEQFARRPGSEGSRGELDLLIEGKSQIPVVFNGSLTNQYRDHLFLPPCGFWIQFLLDKLESEGRISKVFSLSAKDTDLPIKDGEYIVPLFETIIDGFRKEVNLAAVPIDVKEKTISKCDFEEFSRLIGKQSVQPNTGKLFDTYKDLDEFIEIGRDPVEKRFDEKRCLLERENEYRIKARLNSIQNGSEIKIKRLKEEIKKHCDKFTEEGKEPSEKFIRLTESKISGIEKTRESMIKEIQSKCNLSLSSKLVGIVFLKIT